MASAPSPGRIVSASAPKACITSNRCAGSRKTSRSHCQTGVSSVECLIARPNSEIVTLASSAMRVMTDRPTLSVLNRSGASSGVAVGLAPVRAASGEPGMMALAVAFAGVGVVAAAGAA